MNRGGGDTPEWRRRPEERRGEQFRAHDDPIKMAGNKAMLVLDFGLL